MVKNKVKHAQIVRKWLDSRCKEEFIVGVRTR